MKGNDAVVKSLMTSATMEAELATQYHLDKRDLKFQGLDRLAKKFKCYGEDCEDFTKEIVDKVFLLGGSPAYNAGNISEALSVTAIFQRALEKENAIILAFNDYYIVAVNAKDADTRNQYEHWIKDHTHEHIKWLERELDIIETMTEAVYLQMELT
jgi:bacterioferritin (cytochrome b1)